MGKPFKLQNGQLLLSTEAPGGVYSAVQLKKIAELCDGDSAMAKATEDQRLALFVVPEKAAYVASALRSTGLGVRHYQDGLHQPINCIGELCPEHLQDAMGAGIDIAAELAAVKLDSPLKIGINGCARGCVATQTLDISILGESGGYRICIGGKNSQIPEMAAYMADGVPSAKLPKLIAKIVAIYKELAEPGESLQEVVERHGASKFIAALAPYSQDANLDVSSGGSSDLEISEDHEDLKLDDLGVTSQMRHDDPEVDMNLSDVHLASEPSVDGLGPEPVLEDYEEEVIDEAVIDEEVIDEAVIDEAVMDEVVFPGENLAEQRQVETELESVVEAEMPLDLLQPIVEFAEDEVDQTGKSLAADAEIASEISGEIMAAAPTPDMLLEAPSELISFESTDLLTDEETRPESASAEMTADESLVGHIAAQDDSAGSHTPVEWQSEESELKDSGLKDSELEVVDMPLHEIFSEELITDEHVEEEHGEAAESYSEQPISIGSIDAELSNDVLEPEELHFAEAAIEVATSDDSLVHPALLSGDEQDAVPMSDEVKLPAEAAPSVAPLPSAVQFLPPDSLIEDEFAADELNEEDADSFEQKIAAQIADDENLPDIEDTNSSERDETMQLLAAQVEPTELETLEETHMATSNFPAPRGGGFGEGSAQSGPAGFEFIGLDLTDDGRISLQFASGAAMAIDPWALVGNSRRELRLAGKLIVLTPVDQGINVEVDGVSIFLPQKAAA